MLLKSLPAALVLETEIAMANSLGLIYDTLEEQNRALKTFHQAFEAVNSIRTLNDQTLFVRTCYNYAYCLFYNKEYQRVIDVMKKVEAFSQTNHLSYMGGRSCHILAMTYKTTGNLKLAKQYMEKAISIFSLKKNKEYLEKAEKDLNRIRSEMD
ncbi:tetratricopeptide repeat protein [Lentibacillus sediminis]|uniref:tetratricopeptide repeat protein n=1 Tax=Lentibacillus sediminis TaxID=1940529 RepID=UPI000C1C444F|nr:tetratricopeptide repeat protein [Lentibacillus sediminis]